MSKPPSKTKGKRVSEGRSTSDQDGDPVNLELKEKNKQNETEQYAS